MTNSLFQTNIVRRLKFGVPPTIDARIFFDEVICSELDSICAYFGCEPEPSRINILEAQEQWVEDIDDVHVFEESEPDHFKHAGWLCHWLRKKRPIQKLIIRDEEKLTEYFEDSSNEICAFIIGLKLVIFYEACRRGLNDAQIEKIADLGSYLDLLPDIATYLNHKNVSPHAIYLIYQSAMHRSPLDTI